MNIILNCISLVTFCALISLFIGCGKKNEPSDQVKAEKMLYRGEYTQAIDFLEPRVQQKPSDQKLRLLLASAFADGRNYHKSIFKFQLLS